VLPLLLMKGVRRKVEVLVTEPNYTDIKELVTSMNGVSLHLLLFSVERFIFTGYRRFLYLHS